MHFWNRKSCHIDVLLVVELNDRKAPSMRLRLPIWAALVIIAMSTIASADQSCVLMVIPDTAAFYNPQVFYRTEVCPPLQTKTLTGSFTMRAHR